MLCRIRFKKSGNTREPFRQFKPRYNQGLRTVNRIWRISGVGLKATTQFVVSYSVSLRLIMENCEKNAPNSHQQQKKEISVIANFL